jgi:hypothetical protein
VHFIDLPFPQPTPIGVFIAISAQPRCVGQAYAQPLILFEQGLIIFEKVLRSYLGGERLSLVSQATLIKSVLQALRSDQR